MLIQLFVKNLGLISEATFNFETGFTSITGETGSGKTSLIEALKLTLGKKSDFEWIKNGASFALIESVFDLEASHPIFSFLKKEALHIESGETLIFKRQLLKEGKTKAYINQQPVSMHLLQKCAAYLISIIDQHATFHLDAPDFFIDFIDDQIDDKQPLLAYKETFIKRQNLKTELDELYKKTIFKDLRIEELEADIKELSDVKVNQEDENALFEAFKKAQSFAQSAEKLSHHLSLINDQLLPQVRKLRADKVFCEESKKLIESSYLNLQELSFFLEKQIEESCSDPTTLKKLESTLNLIHKLKRKHSANLSDFPSVLEQKKEELATLYHLDEMILSKKQKAEELEKTLENQAQTLSLLRKTYAKQLQDDLCKSLRPLNMPYIELDFVFTNIPLSIKGIDSLKLFIQQNVSSNKVEALHSLSGGELARLNFCLFLEKSKKSVSNTWIFDEIDSSVGGITSALMGERLKELSSLKQVFCITHFPQMVQKADHHYAFEKMQSIENLDVLFRYCSNGPIVEEIDRMIGVKE